MHSLKGISVLVVEDEEQQREFYSVVLERMGAGVLSAASVKDAVRILRAVTPDIILTDIAMPGETGFDLVEHIRQGEKNQQNIPVVALTGYLQESDRLYLELYGFQEIITKPIPTDALIEAILRLARRH